MRKFWWVNQGKTYTQEKTDGIIWAPQEDKTGNTPFHWQNVSKVREGDIVFHYSRGFVLAVSEANENAKAAPKPASLEDREWSQTGWIARVHYRQFQSKIPLAKIGRRIVDLALSHGPLNRHAAVNQGYLFEISEEAAQIITSKLSPEDIPDFLQGEAQLAGPRTNGRTGQNMSRSVVFVFAELLSDRRYRFHVLQVAHFGCSLATKPFTILTGNSGTGKTKLAQLFAQWLDPGTRMKPERYALVPVGADWTDNRNVLGFVNHLKTDEDTGQPTFQSTPILDMVLNANADPMHPYFVILDEMNLSHVERYFSDFLSAMESGEAVPVHSEDDDLPTSSGQTIPPKVTIPPNLFVIGTVNVDETTYMFSPKVLDRANVLEFRVEKDDLKDFLNGDSSGADTDIPPAPPGTAEAFLELSKSARGLDGGVPLEDPPDLNEIQDTLLEFFQVLQQAGFEFAYRTANEVMRYARVSYALKPEEDEWDWQDVMDAQIPQKLLPKLHGSKRRIERTLCPLARLCEKDADVNAILDRLADEGKPPDFAPVAEDQVQFPMSYQKLNEMIATVRRDQFVSFIQ